MRKPTVTAIALGLPLAFAACAGPAPHGPRTIGQVLQDEGSQPMQVPMYLMGKDGTFITNGLLPEPWGDTF